jgi:hypothetical protein
MQYPAAEVIDGDAVIAHEFTHVLLPNSKRMLAENLAVYRQNSPPGSAPP